MVDGRCARGDAAWGGPPLRPCGRRSLRVAPAGITSRADDAWIQPPATARSRANQDGCEVTEELQVVVVEDHPSMRSGLELLLAKQGFRVIGSASSVAEGSAMIAAR